MTTASTFRELVSLDGSLCRSGDSSYLLPVQPILLLAAAVPSQSQASVAPEVLMSSAASCFADLARCTTKVDGRVVDTILI